MKLVIMGPQASGKGTQAEIISEKLGVPHISIGEIFRKEAESGSELGKKLKKFMDRGELVPEQLNKRIVKQVVEENRDGFILDGYPRSEDQAEFLEKITDIDKVIYLHVSDETSLERVSGRRVCPKCEANYHVKYDPPKVEGRCDFDGEELVTREDDHPETVKKRLEIYHEKTAPLLDFYEEKLVRIDGEQSIEEVTEEILKELNV